MTDTDLIHVFSGRVVKRKNIIIALFFLLFAFSMFSMNWVKIEEDTVYFLDESTQSRQCLDIDAREFETFGSMYFMVSHVTNADTEDLIAAVESLDNIAYYTKQIRREEGGTGYTATFFLSFMSAFDAPESMSTYDEVSALASRYDTHYVYSELVDDMEALVNQQMTVVISLIAAAVLLVLLLTSRSYAEIPVFLLVFASAAVINMGTNFLLGTISLISNAVSVTLQLALSLDYAIIFANRYWDAHRSLPVRESVVQSLCGAAPEILASSLTTMAGLMAMTFMTFGLGRDMGMVLVKAIAVSMLTVFLLMPCLLVVFGKAMDRTKHRRLIPEVSFPWRFAHRTRRIMPILFALVLVAAYCLFAKADYLYNEMKAPVRHPLDITASYLAITEELGINDVEILIPVGDYQKEKELLKALSENKSVRSAEGIANIEALDGYCLGDEIGVSDIQALADVDELTADGILAMLALETDGTALTAQQLAAYRAPLIDVFTCLHRHIDEPQLAVSDEQKATVKSLYAQLDRMKKELQGSRCSRIVLSLDAPLDSEETFSLLDTLQQTAASYYPADTHIAGYSVIYRDFAESFNADKVITSALSIVLVMLILLFAFRSAAMPVLLILVIQSSIWLNFGLHSLLGGNLYFICYLIVSSIMMGSNIDYAIVISSRYRELRSDGLAKKDAIIQALSFALPTVLTSGGILALAGILIYEFISTGVVAGFGLYLATGTAITMCLVLFVLPQLLLLTEGIVTKTSFTLKTFRPGARICKVAAAVLCVVLLLFSAAIYAFSGVPAKQQAAEYNEALVRLEDLRASVTVADAALTGFAYYDLVESYLTATIGAQQLADARVELAASKVMLEDGQAQYDAGVSEYAAGLQEYENGKTTLALLEPLYNTIAPGYQRYVSTQAAYKSADASENIIEAAILKAYLATGRFVYETDLTGSGSGSVSALLSRYEAEKAQLAAGGIQLADGKTQLEAGEKELAKYYAAYADGQRQIADAEQMIADAEQKYPDKLEQLRELFDRRAALEDDVVSLCRTDASVAKYGNLHGMALLDTVISDCEDALENARAAETEVLLLCAVPVLLAVSIVLWCIRSGKKRVE